MSILNDIRTRVAKRAAYNRTVREISMMPRDMAIDLDIYPGDAEKIARNAVYGR